MKRAFVLVSAIAAAAVVATAGPATATDRSGDLHVTKRCAPPDYTFQAGGFCTIVSSSLKTIDVGSKVIYAEAATADGLDSDLVLYTGPGNSAFGHVTLSWATLSGVVTFSGGTGEFRHFHATVDVTHDPDPNHPELWHWDGTYSFGGER